MFSLGQRYLLASFVPPFLLGAVSFTILLLIFQMFRIIRLVISKGVGIGTTLELVGHISLSFLPNAIPLALFFAIVYTINKLSRDSEIIALHSLGLGKVRATATFVAAGALVGGALLLLGMNVIPRSKTHFKNTVIRMTNKGVLADIKPGQFFTEIPGVILFAEEVGDGGNKLRRIFINIFKENVEQVIFAKEGMLIKQTYGHLQAPALRLYLSDGNITRTLANTNNVEKIVFKEYDFPIIEGGRRAGLVTKDGMRSYKELRRTIAWRKKKIAESQETDGLLVEIKKRLVRSELEYWGRIYIFVQCILFAFLGFCLGIKKGKGKGRNSGNIGLIVLFGHYAVLFIGVGLAKKMFLSPVLVFILPSLIVAGVGVVLFRKLDWLG